MRVAARLVRNSEDSSVTEAERSFKDARNSSGLMAGMDFLKCFSKNESKVAILTPIRRNLKVKGKQISI